MRLALHVDEEDDAVGANGANGGDESPPTQPTSAFQLLLSVFVVLLHRYTADTDMIVATSSRSSSDPLLLRPRIDPADSFLAVVRKIQFLEREAEADAVPYDALVAHLGREPGTGPLFRVRFFDETDPAQPTSFLQSTSSTSDMTIYVSSTSLSGSSHGSLLPTFTLRLHYNALLFAQARVRLVLDQLLQVLGHVAKDPQVAVGTVSLVTPSQRAVLPDPRRDLDFCGWKGAITDIFSANAARHPERRCIVETRADRTTRTFSYRQIDEASNVLAYHLVAGGIEREDVVTVYSTRGVDLVVAVMGVLKAGATFSVIGAPVSGERS